MKILGAIREAFLNAVVMRLGIAREATLRIAESRARRGEIQGLRALAVALVLLFHIWPAAVPGGYVGVDVFFVISGYLIVGSVAREARETGTISLSGFYARRIRRLLPAASLVLLAIMLGMFVFLPPARWDDTLVQISASAVYAENWYLAWSSADYLAAENAAGPTQHYWSLSIEEQIYIAFPLLALAAIRVARNRSISIEASIGATLGIVFLGSLAASVLLRSDSSYYFATYTRVWELALGGLFAVLIPRIEVSGAKRAVLATTGMTMIVGSAFAYDLETRFPGFAALVPTFGAVAIILAGEFRVGAYQGLDVPQLRYLGDISYSVYLWHWPFLVFFIAMAGRVGFAEGIGLLGLTLIVSHFSYNWVEGPFRRGRQSLDRTYIAAGLASATALFTASGLILAAMMQSDPGDGLRNLDLTSYPGPAALVGGVSVPDGVPLMPPPTDLKRDRAIVYDNGCHGSKEETKVVACEFGDPNGSFAIAAVGSSHSVSWLPALDILGKKNGWKVYSITKSSCSFRSKESNSCEEWHGNLLRYLEKNPVDLIFISDYSPRLATRADSVSVAERWKRIAELGLKILAVRPTPHLDTNPSDCVPDRIERCVIPRASAIVTDTTAVAAATIPDVKVIDMTDLICAHDTCGPVVGNLIVFRDQHHLTATYSAALAPYLQQAMVKAYPNLPHAD